MRMRIAVPTIDEKNRADTKGWQAARRTVLVDAYPSCTPGLVVHESISGAGWTVTHVATGARVAGALDVGEAFRLACRLGPLRDWTQMLPPRNGPQVKALVGQVHAVRDEVLADA